MKKTVNMSRIESIVYERYCDDTGVEQNPDYAELTIKYETNIPVL